MFRHSLPLTAIILAASLALSPATSAHAAEKPKPGTNKDKKAHDHSKDKNKKDKKKDDHGHHHEAPNGGTLIALGDHFAHLELVLDKETGRLKAFVLDGEAEKAVRLKQDSIVIEALLPAADGEPTTTTLTLRPSSNVLTGEKVGDTSLFEWGYESLKGVDKFTGVVKELEIKGTTLKDVKFQFPEGNEH
jgi:Ni/Co efflux regulator RcnB